MLLVLLSPRSSSERFGAGARPVHPIRDKSQASNLRSAEVLTDEGFDAIVAFNGAEGVRKFSERRSGLFRRPFIVNNSIGLITPLVGVVLNVVAGVARIPMADLIRAVWPFMWAELVVLFLMVLFPALVTVPAKWLGG